MNGGLSKYDGYTVNRHGNCTSRSTMKQIVLSLLAVACGGVAASQAAEPVTCGPAAQTTALFASGATVQVSQLYYYGGRRYHHRQFVGYRTQKVVYYKHGVKYVRYNKVPVYRHW